MGTQITAADLREGEDLVRGVFGISDDFDVILFQAEAVALLEAATKSLAASGDRALAVLTSVYGDDMAAWFETNGAVVERIDLRGADRPVDSDEFDAAIRAAHAQLVSVVQGEALTGLVNPVDALTERLESVGGIAVIDSVSSIGAEPFRPGSWGRAISIAGFQKATEGPAGVSAAVIHRGLWEVMAANPDAPVRSFLSLQDIKHHWLDAGRRELLITPNGEEMSSLLTALRRIDHEGIESVEARHADAKLLARESIRGIDGVRLTVADDVASGIATTFVVEEPRLRNELFAALAAKGVTSIKPAPGPLVRWMHYGQDAREERVAAAAAALRAVI
jgi:aspartate aminotransferase-like enzyme